MLEVVVASNKSNKENGNGKLKIYRTACIWTWKVENGDCQQKNLFTQPFALLMSLILGWGKKKSLSQLIESSVSTKKEKTVVNFPESLYLGVWGLHECQVLYRHKCYYLAKTGEWVDRIHSEALKMKAASKKSHYTFFLMVKFFYRLFHEENPVHLTVSTAELAGRQTRIIIYTFQ